MNSRTDRVSRQRGLTAMEAVLSLAVMGTLVVGFGTMLSNSRTNLRLAGAASELQTLRAAGDRYVQDNFASLVTSAASGPVSVPIATLVSQNYLPPGFPTSNAYGQNYQLYVRERSPTVLESLALTTGGTPLSASDGGRIALLLKTAGGYTPVGSSTINGTNGGWSAPLATYVPTAAPQPSGTPAAYSISYVSYGPAGQTGALIRTVTGNPADNQMSTAIDMQNNNINNGGTLTAATFNGTTGNITTANLQHANLPSGGTINFGSSYIYGDSTNTAFRQPGGFYVQDTGGNTRWNVDGGGNTWQAGHIQAASMDAPGNINTSNDMNSNRVWSNYIHSNGNVEASGGGVFYGGDVWAGGGNGPGNFHMWGTTIYDRGDNFHIWSGLTTLDNGGLRFNDGTQQWTAGASPLNWDGGGGFWCNNNQHVNGYHYECGCSNNATWFACAPN